MSCRGIRRGVHRRHRERHVPGGTAAHVRAVRHDQDAGTGYRAWPCDRFRHRGASSTAAPRKVREASMEPNCRAITRTRDGSPSVLPASHDPAHPRARSVIGRARGVEQDPYEVVEALPREHHQARHAHRLRRASSTSRPPRRPGVSAPSSGVRPAPAAQALAGPTRGALDSGHPADAPARLPAALEGMQETGFGQPRFFHIDALIATQDYGMPPPTGAPVAAPATEAVVEAPAAATCGWAAFGVNGGSGTRATAIR
jgi:hypothetical protein